MSTGVQRTRLDSLTSLRFFAALLIVVHHTVRDFGTIPGVSFVMNDGIVGVGFFFVLSGFVLTWSSRQERPPEFYRRRFARVYPLHFLTWAVALVGFLIASRPVGGLGAVASLLLLQAWAPSTAVFYGLNAPSWSLSCEAFFYAVFPWIAHRRWLPRIPLWPTVAAVTVVLIAANSVIHNQWPLYIFPPVRLAEFVVGILLAQVVRSGRRAPVGIGVAAGITAGMFLILAWPLQVVLGAWQGLADGLMLPCWVLLIWAAAHADLTGRARRLVTPGLIRLGEWSFALYLTHWLLLQLVEALDRGIGGHPLPLRVVEDAAFVCVAVAVSAVAYVCWERPLERRLRRAAPRPEAVAVER